MQRPTIRSLMFIATLLAACRSRPNGTADPTPEPFVDQTLSSSNVDVLVEGDEGPLFGAVVLIRDANLTLTDGGSTNPVLFTARTDEGGHATGLFSRPTVVTSFEITIIKAGFRGELDTDAAQLGPFAPASRFRVAAAATITADVQLSQEQSP